MSIDNFNYPAFMLVCLTLCMSLAAISGLLALQRRVSEIGRAVREGWTKSSRSRTDLSGSNATLSIELTPELNSILDHIKNITGEELDEVVVKAITLYRFSVDAHKEGKRIVVLDENFELEREVVGFDTHSPS